MSPSTLTAPPATPDLHCTLGECLLWDTASQHWLWTDIESSCLYRWAGGVQAPPQRHTLPSRLGSFALARSGRLLLGLAKGLAWGRFDASGGLVVEALLPVEAHEPHTRINDGRADRSGSFVFGTYNEGADQRPIGSFYQYSVVHGLRRLALPSVTIPNSICFSPDGRTMYFTDSPTGLIQQCAYDSDSAHLGPPQPFARVAGPAEPDGSVIDADGCLWNAQWGTGRVQRYSPRGEPLQRVQTDAPHITCPAFGGPGLGTLMVTSARKGLSPQALLQAPLSGAVFSCVLPGCTGLPEATFDDAPADVSTFPPEAP